jgi:hypothetical protein
LRVLTEDAEAAIRRLNALSGFYRVSKRSVGIRGFARLRRASGATVAGQLRTLYEVTLVRCVSVIEAFALDLGEAGVREKLRSALDADEVADGTKDLIRYLLDEKWSTFESGSWPRLVAFWENGLEVAMPQDFPHWQELGLLRETREYTPKYRRVARSRLRALGIDPDQATGLIPLAETDVERSIALARNFVLWVDQELRL